MSTTNSTRSIKRSTFMDALEASGFNEYEIRESYTGRGMDRSECFGVVVEPSDERRVYVALGWACGYAEGADQEDDMPMWEGLIRSATADSMGRQVIVYFPRWSLA